MFSGIVSGIGEVLDVEEKSDGLRRLVVTCDDDPNSIAVGASIACSGICLTVVERGTVSGRPFFAIDTAAKRVGLELGGKSAHIIFADADLEPASTTAAGVWSSRVGSI